MRKFAIAVVAILLSVLLHAQEGNPSSNKRGLVFAFNQMPVLYLKPFTGDFNGIWYGYHIGYIHKMNQLNLRGGVNFNTWKYGNSQQNRNTTIGIELGVEYPLLRPERKWILNPAMNIWVGNEWVSYFRPFYRKDYQWYMIGPDILFGRKFGTHWIVTSETSIGIGRVGFAGDGKLNLYGGVRTDLAKFLGLGVRYCFN